MIEDTDDDVLDPPAAPPVAPPTTGEAATDARIEAWFQKHFHGLGAHVSVDLYNKLYEAKLDLLQLLAK